MYPRIGVVEIVLLCFSGIFVIGIPTATLVLVAMLYKKVRDVEQKLNNHE